MKKIFYTSLLIELYLFVSTDAASTTRNSRESNVNSVGGSLRALRGMTKNQPEKTGLSSIAGRSKSFGEKELLVVRIQAQDSSTTATKDELVRDIFDDSDGMTVTKQLQACSHGMFTIKPATGQSINNGVATIQLDYVIGKSTEEIYKSIDYSSKKIFGRELNKFDHVMMCMPSGTTIETREGDVTDKWNAYVPGDYEYTDFLTLYNDKWCSSISAGMHEIGHNLGLEHSNESGVSYEDETGQMGFSGIAETAALRCYNPAKLWQLGWYAEHSRRIQPFMDAPFHTTLTGITREFDENDDPSRNFFLQIPNGQTDIYIGYNHAVGFNAGTREAKNKIVVLEQETGARKPSDLKAILGRGESYTIEDYQGSGEDLVIQMRSKTSNGMEAKLEVSFKNQRDAPKKPICKDDQVRFEVSVKTDTYADDTSWVLKSNDQTKAIVASRSDFERNKTHNDMVCIDRGKDYVFTVRDKWKDGICCNYGWGSYSVFVDGKEIFYGGDFDSASVSHTFRTKPNPKPQEPLTLTRASPESKLDACVDDPSFSLKDNRNCEWVAKDTENRCGLKRKGAFVKYWCPATCGLCNTHVNNFAWNIHEKGPCRDDPSYRYHNKKRCWWIGKDKTRCKKEWNGKLAEQDCPMSCGLCDANDGETTLSLFAAPTINSGIVAAATNTVICRDDPSYLYAGRKSCVWVAKDAENRCGKESEGTLVRDHCRATCNLC